MNKIILGFVGEIASGKGLACDFFVRKHNASYYKFSTILREHLKSLCLPISRENMQDLSTLLRKRFGENVLSNVMAQKINSDPGSLVVVDGLRVAADFDTLKQLDNFYLINITADEKVRYERVTSRDENDGDSQKTFEEFLKDHEKETEVGIKNIGERADFEVDNSGTIEDLYKRLEELYQKIKS